MVLPVIIRIQDYCELISGQSAKKMEKRLFFRESRISPAVDTKTHYAVLFQKAESLFHRLYTSLRLCCDPVVSTPADSQN